MNFSADLRIGKMPELEQCCPIFPVGRRGFLQDEILLSKTMVFHFVKSIKIESYKKHFKEKILDSIIYKVLYDQVHSQVLEIYIGHLEF